MDEEKINENKRGLRAEAKQKEWDNHSRQVKRNHRIKYKTKEGKATKMLPLIAEGLHVLKYGPNHELAGQTVNHLDNLWECFMTGGIDSLREYVIEVDNKVNKGTLEEYTKKIEKENAGN